MASETCFGLPGPEPGLFTGLLKDDDLSSAGDEGDHEGRHAHGHQEVGVALVEADQQELPVQDTPGERFDLLCKSQETNRWCLLSWLGQH